MKQSTKQMWGMIWGKIKIFCWRFLGALLLEEKGESKTYAVSLGRVVLLFTLCYLAIIWTKALKGTGDLDAPAGLMEVFYVASGYVFGGKVVDAVRRR
jgi:hypothetical protein